jgi:hypothetical protein
VVGKKPAQIMAQVEDRVELVLGLGWFTDTFVQLFPLHQLFEEFGKF